MLDDHERKLEKEMVEAAKSVADFAGVDKDPLLIILWRLNHQDRTLESIKADLGMVGKTLSEHIAREGTIQESIDEMVSMWKGSKVVGKILTWGIGIAAAIGAAWASVKKGFS
jgi:hypothetical protein